MQSDDTDKLVAILSKQATTTPGLTPQTFFNNLLRQAPLPEPWVQQWAGVWTGNARYDARQLVGWALAQGTNPQDRRYTTLGSLLPPLLSDVGLEDASTIAALIVAHQLYRDPGLIERLVIRYQVPLPQPAGRVQAPPSVGPAIDWQGPTDTVELQAWLQPVPDFQDVGFLKRAIEQATAVCRIELPSRQRTGTGFLVADRLVLTCYHVLKWDDSEDLQANARDVLLRFGYFTAKAGQETEGQAFRLDPYEPIQDASSTAALDYVLLAVHDSIAQASDITPVSYDSAPPAQGTALNILQHPAGAAMKLTISKDGVTGVYPERGLIQYVTRALGGSSGAPCFNDDWKVVGIHHAEHSRHFGTIREGILFGAILDRIKDRLLR